MIILCSSFLILYFLVLGFFYFFNGPTKLETLQIIIREILYIIPYGYLMLIFIEYFRYYQLKVLQTTTITILIFEIINRGSQFTNLFNYSLPRFLLPAITAIWTIAAIIWIIFLFIPKMKDYPAMISIRRYAMGLILIFFIGLSIPFLVKPDNIFAALQLLCIICAIPYIFTIDFALKLQLKE